MARKILQETTYTFNPSTRTIVIPRNIPRERLVLITNVTSNTVIYNFSDNTLTATSYTNAGGQTFPQNTVASQASGQTTIVLQYNTTSMSSGDKLQFLIDEYEERFLPAEQLFDPANKLRVSTPQALIDTDFELGLQTTKWEFYQSQNTAQSVYVRPTDNPLQPVYAGQGYSLTAPSVVVTGTTPNQIGTITGLSLAAAPAVGSYVYVIDTVGNTNFSAVRYTVNSGTTTSQLVFNIPTSITNSTYTPQLLVIGGIPGVAGSNPSYVIMSVNNTATIASQASVGLPILINETFDEIAGDGTYTISHLSTVNSAFAFLPKNSTANFNVLNKPGTVAYLGAYYGTGYAAGSALSLTNIVSDGARTMTVTTAIPHGLTVGAPIFIANTTQTNANGPWYVLAVPSSTTFTYATIGTVTAGSIIQVSTTLNLRPEGVVAHRPGDGGVQITTGNNAIGNQVARQTRRYFRYQSGKGIQFSTAFTFKPNYDIVSISVAGTIATITTDQDHGLKPGAIVRFTGLIASNVTDSNIYNNTAYVVLASQSITLRTFSVQLSATPTDVNPGGSIPTVEVVEAKGYTARAGLFDDQNGMFWEYDGASINAVRRNSTAVLRGTTINVLTGSTLVTGDTRSKFTRQVSFGDKIVIRGQTYQVMSVVSDVQMIISPAYRAATPSTAQGTSGLSYSTLTAASSQTQTINISTTTTTSSITSTSGTGGGAGVYYFTNTFSNTVAPTGSAGGIGLKTFTVSAATSIVPGMLVLGTGIPANTYVDTSYVSGTTSVPLTNSMTSGASGTYYFYLVPCPGSIVTGTGIANNTAVSSIAFTTTGTTTTVAVTYINQAMTATATGSYVYGLVNANISTNVISLATTYGIAPGMLITGSGIPGNCLVAFVQNQGTGIVLNQPITVTAGISSGVTLTFTTQHNLYAVSQNTGASTTTVGSTTITMASIVGIQIGSFITSATAGQYISIGTYVTGISGLNITLSQATILAIPGSTTLTFGSRVFVSNSSQLNVNGQWPVASVTTSAITFQTTAAAATTGTISTSGTTKIYGEDLVARKFIVRELRIPQTNFNIDRLDGTGPSGYSLDPTKVQMIFMDYTWYGAGFVRWGMRTINGDVIYAHKLQHGNTNYQAYLRSGNLPGRFELMNMGANPQITANITSSGYTITPNAPGTINVYDASRFFIPFTGPAGEGKNGEILIDGEYFFYTGLSSITGQAPWAVGDNGVTSVATLGTPTVSAGQLVTIPVTSGGAGYTAPPPVIISGPGAGARAIANIVGGSVVSVTVTAGGSGYTTAPSVYIGANQLTGVVREPNAVSVGALTGAVSTSGSTSITSVSNASSFYIGMKLGAIAAFNNQPVTITGITGTTVNVDTVAVTSGSISISPIQKGSAVANHYAANNTGAPTSTALNTNQQLSPAAQHWGVSCMMDGRFDNDKSYVFTTPRQTAAVIQANQTAPVMSIRVCPSVSLGFGRNFGVRDIINRMQLNLYQMDVYTSGQFLITVRYNCSSNVFQPAVWSSNAVGSGSLSQVIYHNPQDVVTGGDVILAFYATNAGSGIFATTQQDLTIVKDLGNSVIGGDSVYPDGPDVITVFATNLSTSAPGPIYARLSWNEAQA